MPLTDLTRRAAILVAALFVATACDDSDPLDPDPEPDIEQVILQVEGGMRITFNRADIADGTLTLRDGAVVTLSFLDPDGQDEENANNTERFDLVVDYPGGNPAGLSFTPSAADEYSGTFTRTSPTAPNTTMIVRFTLVHTSEDPDHADGRWNVSTIVE
jgi:hypothetical protein